MPETHLLENQWALPYLDAQGVHYYLPAVMSFALRHRCPGDWIVESLGYKLQRYRGETHGLFERLDPAQRMATYAYALVSGDALAAARWRPS